MVSRVCGHAVRLCPSRRGRYRRPLLRWPAPGLWRLCRREIRRLDGHRRSSQRVRMAIHLACNSLLSHTTNTHATTCSTDEGNSAMASRRDRSGRPTRPWRCWNQSGIRAARCRGASFGMYGGRRGDRTRERVCWTTPNCCAMPTHRARVAGAVRSRERRRLCAKFRRMGCSNWEPGLAGVLVTVNPVTAPANSNKC
jgi:hypothetical protein